MLITDNTDPCHNLGLEKYLFDNLENDSCLLYLWQNEKTVVIGRNQNAENECNIPLIREDGARLVRRLTGGGAVYHDLGNLNFSLICPKEDFDEANGNNIILNALISRGIKAEKSGRNDLLIDGKKFSGQAFYHHEGKSLHHGTIMLDVDKDKVSRYLNVSLLKLNDHHVKSVKSRVMNLREVTDLSLDDLRETVIASYADYYGKPLTVFREEELDQNEIKANTAFFADGNFINPRHQQLPIRKERRFHWGTVQLEYQLENGIITDINLYSDALDTDYLSLLPGLLKGQSVNQLSLPDNHDMINQDILKLFNQKKAL